MAAAWLVQCCIWFLMLHKKGGKAFLYLMRVSTQPDNVFVHFASLTCLECTLLWVHFKDDEWAGVNHTALWFECSNGGVRMWISNFNIYICRVKADKSIKTQKRCYISDRLQSKYAFGDFVPGRLHHHSLKWPARFGARKHWWHKLHSDSRRNNHD